MRIQVLGAGSLGSLVGALLARSGADVRLVGRERVVDAFDDGVRVVGEEGFVAHPSVSTEAAEADVTLVTVKSYDTDGAARSLAGVGGLVVSLQNGMGNEETLDRRLEAEVLGGTATYGANLRDDLTAVEYTGEGTVTVGDYRGGPSEDAERVAGALDGLNAEATDSMDTELWRKLAVNTAINPVTALTRLRNGEAARRAEGVMRSAARETALVARENGADLRPDEAEDRALEVARRTSENESSTLQDVLAGRRTEIDALNGYVVDSAKGTENPTNRTLTRLVRATVVRAK